MIKYFLWQLVSGCIAVKKNLTAREIQGEICCDRWGATEESINHVFFECLPARQVWPLSKTPLNPAFFPTSSLFTNMDHSDPSDTLKLTKTESTLSAEAHVLKTQRAAGQFEVQTLPSITGRWCFTDSLWKDKEPYSGQGWYSILEGFDVLMETRNVRTSLPPLHSEIEALIWSIECMRNLRQFQVMFATDCSQLVKMVSEP